MEPVVVFSSKDVILGVAAFIVLWMVGMALYDVFLHPLRHFPGPLSHRISRLPYSIKAVRGILPLKMLDLHEKYGPVVRVAPNELAFTEPSAWKDIMGHKTGGGEEFQKWTAFYRPMDITPPDVVSADREEHGMLRRQLAHGFSDRSMRSQEPMIKKYVDLLMQRLNENRTKGPVNIVAWYNYTTFDVIGELAFGESFDCLNDSDFHPWVRMIFQTAKFGTILQFAGHYPKIKNTLLGMIPKSMFKEYEDHTELVKQKLLRRMEMKNDRPDLIEGLLKKKDEWNMPIEKIQQNAGVMVIAGSETTATLLSGVTYFILTNPDVMSKLKKEVRTAFKSEEEIDINTVGQLNYMLACLDEALRMYSPVSIGLPRVAPKGGATISGHYVPEDTIVAIHHWATYHYSENFTKPFEFHPERHLDDPAFSKDKREALQPFHVGPRNCLGRNLAYTEMRLILARVIYNFDMKIAEESKDWLNQKVYNFWEKGPLYVTLTPVART